jgi:REP-associated tyrosine transposase
LGTEPTQDKAMRSRYMIHNENGIYFVTSTIVHWIPVFVNEKYFDIMINTIKHYQQKNNLMIYAYVFMNNHFPMIISHEDISKIMQSAKKYSAKEIIKNLTLDNNEIILKAFRDSKPEYKTTSKHQVWQESFHQLRHIKMLP